MVPKSGVPTFIETQIFGIVAKLNENTPRGGGVGGSSIVKVPGDVPPARVCFFNLLV